MSNLREPAAPTLTVGEWTVDPATNQISRHGELVHLEPKVVDLLVVLARHANEVVSRDALLAEVWSGVVVGDDVLTQGIIKLRKALGDTAKEAVYIQTFPKRGYRLSAPVTWIAEERPATIPSRGETSVTPDGATPQADPSVALARAASSAALAPPAPRRRRVTIAWVLGAALVVATVLSYWFQSRQTSEATQSLATLPVEAEAVARIDELPKVMVYPFREIDGDPVQSSLARGITSHLITDLGRFADLRIISLPIESANAPLAPGADLRKGNYIVRGDVQRSADKVRLFIHLFDAPSGESLWSERYDRPYTDLLSLQDELTRKILDNLRIKVSDAELRRRAKPYTTNLQAYEYFLRAQLALNVRRREDNETARSLYLKAIELDSGFARAYAGLALTYAADRRNRWVTDPAAALARASALARTAQQLDPESPEVLFALAFVDMEHGEFSAAIAGLRGALQRNPSYADAYALLGGIRTYDGHPAETLPLMRAAMRLAPDSGYLYSMILGRAYFFLGDTDQALFNLREAVARNGESVESRLYLAATLERAGQHDAAAWEAVEIHSLEPAFDIREWLRAYPLVDGDQRDRLARTLLGLKL